MGKIDVYRMRIRIYRYIQFVMATDKPGYFRWAVIRVCEIVTKIKGCEILTFIYDLVGNVFNKWNGYRRGLSSLPLTFMSHSETICPRVRAAYATILIPSG
jgi:hypothetical protein